MTEDEAKTKWCPFVRAARDGGDFSANRDRDGTVLDYKHTCIASACMAWRWSEPKRTAAFLEAVQRHMQASEKPNFNTSVQAVYAETGGQFERVEGRCGLAGAPS